MSITTTRVIQIGVVLCCMALAIVVLWRYNEPDRIEWVSVSTPIVTADKLSISAEARRRPIDGCTNGPQIELKKGIEDVRLPVPTRTIRGTISLYETDLIRPLSPGKYTIKLRESVICPGLTQVKESPAIEFVVP